MQQNESELGFEFYKQKLEFLKKETALTSITMTVVQIEYTVCADDSSTKSRDGVLHEVTENFGFIVTG